MGKKIVYVIVIAVCLICSPLMSMGAFAYLNEPQGPSTSTVLNQHQSSTPAAVGGNSSITIVTPQAGYLYLFKLKPIKLPLAGTLGLGYAAIIGSNLNIETEATNIHHAKFVATRLVTGWQTVRWDYRNMDGIMTDFSLSSGIYTITVTAYDDTDHELASDSIRVFYLKMGQENFGIWVNTKYNGGETISTPLHVGISDFTSMLQTGLPRNYTVAMQNQGDTNVELRFTRTKIMNSTEKVIEAKCNVDTSCDSTKEYEVSLEVRFPFVILDGGQPSGQNNPYFSAQIGYQSNAGSGGANHVNTTFFFGRENLNDPRVFRLSVKPENIEPGSQLTFFTTYVTVNASGDEVFQRTYSIQFEPATELTITSIPREAKISYEFGRSAGVPTRISLRAEGGALDDIVQTFAIDPLPSYMNFDLTIIGSREFLYQSDRSYNVSYALDSIQNGNLVTFQVLSLPEQIHASWGLDLGTVGDFAASSFVDLNMTRDVGRLALFFYGNDRPFISLDNFPRKIHFENAVNVRDGTGNITFIRGQNETRRLNVSIAYQDMVVTKSFELKNNLVQMNWKIDLANGTGFFDISRDSEAAMTFTTAIEYKNWTFTKQLELRNNHLQLSWNINREQRTGQVILSRDAAGGSPTLSFSIAHDGWVLDDTLEFNNEYLELLWQLPTSTNTHAQIGLITQGGEIFHNTISVVDNAVELLHIGFGIQTDDHFILSWDYLNHHVSNFSWSGKLLSLTDVDIAVNLVGDVFTVSADLTVGDGGSVELQFNRDVNVTFVDTSTDTFKLHGNVSVNANRRLQLSWELGETGYFTIYTFGQPLGDAFSLEVGYDPQHTGNYKYGFRLTGDQFVEITRTIQWYSENGSLVRIWILGDVPLPGDWTVQVLWNSVWYNVPWP